MVAEVLKGTLDALSIDRAHVVGASIGEVWALRLAQRCPGRVIRIVLLGAGPLLRDVTVPRFIKLLSTPLGAIIIRLPQRLGMSHAQLRGLGRGESLDAGRMDEDVTWQVAFQRHTDSMRNERNMVKTVASWRGFRPGVVFDDVELAGIQQPTLHVYGTANPVTDLDIVKRGVDLLPNADLLLVDSGGHLPWFDDPGMVGTYVSRFLRG